MKKIFNIKQFPEKYHKFYNYARSICDVLKQKTAKIKISD